MSRRATVLVASLAALTLLLGAGAALLARDDWNWAKPFVARVAEQGAGRRLAIDGDLRVRLSHWGRRAEIDATGVRFANARWSTTREMLVVPRVALDLRPFSFLRGSPRIDRLEAEGARLALERRADGETNWTLGRGRMRDGDEPPALPSRIALRDFELTLTDPSRPEGFALRVDALEARTLGAVRLIAGNGVYQKERFALESALLGLPRRGDGPTPFAARAAVGTTRGEGRGWIGDGTGAKLFAADLALRGESLDDVWRLTGFPVPRSPAFTLAGRLAYGDRRVSVSRFRGLLGKSDVAGDVVVELPEEGRMAIGARLRSREIDLDDFEGFWGRPPREEKAEATAVPAGSPASVFPDVPFHFPKLRVADARVDFAAGRIRGRNLLDHVRLVAQLKNGVLDLAPLSLGMSAGSLDARARIDARGRTTRLDADLVLRGVELAELLRRLEVEPRGAGEFGGRAAIASTGNSLHELARNVDGEIGTVLQNGRLSDALLELLALHLGDYIAARLDDDEEEVPPIRCLVGVFDGKDGRFEARTMLLDTAHVRIEGRGSFDLGREHLDLELRQRSKDFTIGALRTPIVIEGPFLGRRAKLETSSLAKRGGAAVALGAALHPLAALLALVDPGTDDKPGACAAALAEYRPIAGDVRIAQAAAPRAPRAKRPPKSERP